VALVCCCKDIFLRVLVVRVVFFPFSFQKVTTLRSPFNNSGTIYKYYTCFCLHVQHYFQYITVKREISSLSYELHYMFWGQRWTFVNSLAEAQHTMCLFCICLLSLCLSLSIYIHRFTHIDGYIPVFIGRLFGNYSMIFAHFI